MNQPNELLIAAKQGDLDIVKNLIEQNNARIQCKDTGGNTPLSLAAYNGHLEVVKYLQSKGSEINIRDNEGDTPLSLAAFNGHLEVVKYLEMKGSDVNHRGNYGHTPLFLAACYGHLELIQHLLLNGAGIGEKLLASTRINYRDIILLCATTSAGDPVTKLIHPEAIIELDEFENHIKQFPINRLFILLNALALKTSEMESTNKEILVKATNITIAECIAKVVNRVKEQSDELSDSLVILKRCSAHIEKLNERSTTIVFKNLLNALSVFSMKFSCAKIIAKNNLERLSIWSRLPIDLKEEMPQKINFYRSLPDAFLKPITSSQGGASGSSADPDHPSITVNVRSSK